MKVYVVIEFSRRGNSLIAIFKKESDAYLFCKTEQLGECAVEEHEVIE